MIWKALVKSFDSFLRFLDYLEVQSESEAISEQWNAIVYLLQVVNLDLEIHKMEPALEYTIISLNLPINPVQFPKGILNFWTLW